MGNKTGFDGSTELPERRLPWKDTPMHTHSSAGLAAGWYLTATSHHFLKDRITNRLMVNIQRSLDGHIQDLSLDFFQTHRLGEISSRLTGDIYQSVGEIYYSFSRIVWILALVVPSFVTMASFTAEFFLIFIAVTVFFVFVSRLLLPRIRSKEREVRDLRGRITARITENIYSAPLIKAFGREKHSIGELEGDLKKFLGATFRYGFIRICFQDFIGAFMSVFSPVFILCAGVFLRLDAGMVVAFFSSWQIVGNRFNVLLENIAVIFQALASFDRVTEIFRVVPRIKDSPRVRDLKVGNGGIRFRNVTFAYPVENTTPALVGVDFSMNGRGHYAIVGPSGAGKSTVINLLMRFYDPKRGSILIDGQNLKNLRQQSLRDAVGIVMQETVLFSGNVRENLLFAKTTASESGS